jgi:hypothetical protein
MFEYVITGSVMLTLVLYASLQCPAPDFLSVVQMASRASCVFL